MGAAHDIENAVLHLSSDEADLVTGMEIDVDGGLLAIRGRYERPADAPPFEG